MMTSGLKSLRAISSVEATRITPRHPQSRESTEVPIMNARTKAPAISAMALRSSTGCHTWPSRCCDSISRKSFKNFDGKIRGAPACPGGPVTNEDDIRT